MVKTDLELLKNTTRRLVRVCTKLVEFVRFCTTQLKFAGYIKPMLYCYWCHMSSWKTKETERLSALFKTKRHNTFILTQTSRIQTSNQSTTLKSQCQRQFQLHSRNGPIATKRLSCVDCCYHH
jgi:hypothetical protein